MSVPFQESFSFRFRVGRTWNYAKRMKSSVEALLDLCGEFFERSARPTTVRYLFPRALSSMSQSRELVLGESHVVDICSN